MAWQGNETAELFGGCVPCVSARRAAPLLGIQAYTVKIFSHATHGLGVDSEHSSFSRLRFVLVVKWRAAYVRCGLVGSTVLEM